MQPLKVLSIFTTDMAFMADVCGRRSLLLLDSFPSNPVYRPSLRVFQPHVGSGSSPVKLHPEDTPSGQVQSQKSGSGLVVRWKAHVATVKGRYTYLFAIARWTVVVVCGVGESVTSARPTAGGGGEGVRERCAGSCKGKGSTRAPHTARVRVLVGEK